MQCTSFLFRAKEAGAGEESRGIRQRFSYWCNETKANRTAGRRVTVEPTSASPPEPLAGKDHLLLGQLVLVVSLQTWSLWDPFPPNIWEEDQGLYK